MIMMRSIIRLTLLMFLACSCMVLSLVIVHYSRQKSTIEPTCFNAAVLDHTNRIEHFFEKDRKKVLEENFLIFLDATKIAKENEVDLIVFPESALPHFGNNRSEVLKNTEILPEFEQLPSKVLCKDDQNLYDSTVYIVERLSCLAKIHEIYLVAQLLDKQPCSKNCTHDDGFYLFNTAIMFDRKGRLIAKYHKMQPYGELMLDAAPKDELIYIDTDLGRLGFQICFDLIYNKPGHVLATKMDVDTIIFPTNWFNELPFLAASSLQMAWSFGNNVNLLASNMHRPESGSVGSGIYNGPGRYFLNANFANDTAERLVIARIPKKPRSGTKCNPGNDKIIQIPVKDLEVKPATYSHKHMRLDNLTALQLKENKIDNLLLEHNGVRCFLSYQANFSMIDSKEGAYFLLASNRSRPDGAYNWWEQFCAITYCTVSPNGNNCSKFSSNNFETFQWIKMIGEFDNRTYVYPSAVEYQHRPIPLKDTWTFWSDDDNDLDLNLKNHTIEFGSSESTTTSQQYRKLSIISLYGRLYELDPPYKQVKPDGFSNLN